MYCLSCDEGQCTLRVCHVMRAGVLAVCHVMRAGVLAVCHVIRAGVRAVCHVIGTGVRCCTSCDEGRCMLLYVM